MSEFEIAVTERERAAGRLDDDRWHQAALLLHTAGCVVLRDLLPLPLVENLRKAFAVVYDDCVASKQGDAWYQVASATQAVFWERGARWRIFPKLRAPFDDEVLLANTIITSLCADLLGHDFICKFIASDTCVRGSRLQAPHRELGAGGVSRPCAYIVNVPLALSGLGNGPLEVWPGGSHLWQNDLLARYGVPDDAQDEDNPRMEAFARRFPSRRLVLEPGSVLIRDPGMLHRGTANGSDEPRTMLTICYTSKQHSHDYGDTRYNVDEALYGGLPDSVRSLVAAPTVAASTTGSAAASAPARSWARRLFRN
jgi:ectoine hydroxylase-related dioxygenase (phytanoyl-CoA dioxygenase family)